MKNMFKDLDTISIHALCEEGDTENMTPIDKKLIISIHALCEEGDFVRCRSWAEIADFYPRPLRGGRHLTLRKQIDEDKISIHALCEEGDQNQAV